MEENGPIEWSVDAWEDGRTGKSPFESWLSRLDQYEQAVVLTVIDKIVKPLGIDICNTEWGKALGNGLYEIRIRRSLHAIQTWGTPNAEPSKDPKHNKEVLLRLFVTFHGKRVVLLFQGYNKKKDPSEKRQNREIARARKHLKAWKKDH